MFGNWLYNRTQRQGFANFGGHDLARFMNAWAEDAVFLYPGTTSMAGRFEGKPAIQEWFRRYMDTFPRIEFTVQDVCVRGAFGLTSNVACTHWEVAVTNRQGEDYRYDGMTLIRVKGAKVVHATDYIFDTSVLAQALGEQRPAASDR